MIETKFKVGDYVVSRCSGVGVVISVDDDPDVPYPIRVKWTGDIPRLLGRTDVFTMDGRYTFSGIDPDRDIYCVPYEEEDEEMSEKVKFKVGDRVYAPFHGYGTVIKVHEHPSVMPVVVKWDNSTTSLVEEVNSFTEDGYLSRWTQTDDTRITIAKEPSSSKDEAGEAKYTPTNPAHYRVKGIPEAIEIMGHLMTKEQLEGFLWGNIIKYAYRYGRKGDEAETAGKIEWYANRLKEVRAEKRKEQEQE